MASILKTPIAVTEPRDIAKNLTLFFQLYFIFIFLGGGGVHGFVPNILGCIFELAFNLVLIVNSVIENVYMTNKLHNWHIRYVAIKIIINN